MTYTTALSKNLITSKDASKFSGYTADYLTQLLRSKKINGQRLGRNWVIERDSFIQFLGQQGKQRGSRSEASLSLPTKKRRIRTVSARAITLTYPQAINVSSVSFSESAHSLLAKGRAFSVACIVLFAAAALAQSPYFSLASMRVVADHALVLSVASLVGVESLGQGAIQSHIALGAFVIEVTHQIIKTEVAIVYGLSALAPLTARTTFVAIATMGDGLYRATAHIPTLATETVLMASAFARSTR